MSPCCCTATAGSHGLIEESRKGAAKLRAILHGDVPVTLSRLESRFLELLSEADLPLPETNRPAGGRRVDCRWPEHRLTVELDSYRYHSSRHAWEQDRLREREARARGDEFRRYSHGDVFDRPRLMLAELPALLPGAACSPWVGAEAAVQPRISLATDPAIGSRGPPRPVSPRILILSWEYPPIVAGGLARHVRKLSEELVTQGVEVHVLTRGGREHPAEEERAGVRVHRVAEPEMPTDLDAFVAWVEAMNAHMLAAGRRLGKRMAFDVVHGHDWLVAGAAAGLSERLRCPYLTTIHATEYGRHQGWVDKHPQSYIHGIETWMAGRADRIVVCSHYMRGHVADVYDIAERRVAVIPNGIDPTDLRPVGDLPELRARFAAPGERLIVLVGRLVYEKGFQLALDAMPRVIRRAGRVRFLVAGSGTHEAELRRHARRLGLMEHGAFLGWIGDDVLHSLYRIADLCVVPSIYEPFGLVALEAMASGCPCIVADTGGLREVVPNDDVGLRFRSRDPRSLAEMIERVLTDDALRDRLVAEASEHVLRFDWTDVARRTAEVYGELTGAAAVRAVPRGA